MNRIKKAFIYVKDDRKMLTYKIIDLIIKKKAIRWFIPSKIQIKIDYYIRLGKKLNLKDLKTFNEKLQWLKLYDRNPLYTNLVDKHEVRKYISKTIGKEYLIPSIGVWDKFEDIDFSKLPNQFVLKCTHDSGGLVICIDKNKLDIQGARKKINGCLKRNYYYNGREWPYKNIKPRIVCEKFISETNNTPNDYKVLCFNGKAKLVKVHINRFGNHKLAYYDEKWHKKSISSIRYKSDIIHHKPLVFEKMIQLSNKLAAKMIHVRIDWFIVHDRLYFGEITFFNGSGFIPFDKEEDDVLLGSWIRLPTDKG